MKRYFNFIRRLYEKEIDASGLAAFRIIYSTVLLCEIAQIFYFRHLIFDKIPFLEPSEIDFTPALIAWMATVFFLILGLFTRQAAIANYIFSLVFLAAIRTYEYHMFYTYMGINLLLIFLNTSRVNSLDRLRDKFKYRNVKFNYRLSRKVSVLNYYVPLLLGIGFVYFDSTFYKLASHNWMTGIGMWLPSSLPHIARIDATQILNVKWLVIGVGYLVLVFEMLFLFTFFRRTWRIPMLLIGISLHICIVIQFPIPWFGLGVASLYLLMVPVKFWSVLGDKIKRKKPILTIYYAEDRYFHYQTRVLLSHFDLRESLQFRVADSDAHADDSQTETVESETSTGDLYLITSNGNVLYGIKACRRALLHLPVFFPIGVLLYLPGFYHVSRLIYRTLMGIGGVGQDRKHTPFVNTGIEFDSRFSYSYEKYLQIFAISVGLGVLSILQLNVTYNSKLINEIKSWSGISDAGIEESIQKFSSPVASLSRVFLGITTHAVFMDSHFDNYNHIIGIQAETDSGVKIWLPIIDKDGHPGTYIYSFNWVKWTFRVNSPSVEQERLASGIRDFATFWAIRNGFDIEKLKFNIFLKKCHIPKTWQRDFIRSQQAIPWERIGIAYWRSGIFLVELPTIESI